MSLIILTTLLIGLWLFVVAIGRFKQNPTRSLGLMLLALLINSWWIVILVMFLFKTLVLKQDT